MLTASGPGQMNVIWWQTGHDGSFDSKDCRPLTSTIMLPTNVKLSDPKHSQIWTFMQQGLAADLSWQQENNTTLWRQKKRRRHNFKIWLAIDASTCKRFPFVALSPQQRRYRRRSVFPLRAIKCFHSSSFGLRVAKQKGASTVVAEDKGHFCTHSFPSGPESGGECWRVTPWCRCVCMERGVIYWSKFYRTCGTPPKHTHKNKINWFLLFFLELVTLA